MKAVLINTTFQLGHHGCTLVDRQLDKLAAEAGLEMVAKLPLHSDWERLAPRAFDVVIVNGEGALHHNSKAAKRLAEVPVWARERRRPAYLINSVYEGNGPEIAAGVARYAGVFTRDELSHRALSEAGIASTVVPDLTLTWQPAVLGGKGRLVVVTDSTVRTTNMLLRDMAIASGAHYLPLMARPPRFAEASRRWRYAAKRLVARVAPPGLWRDRWQNLIPDFEDYIEWMADNAGLVVAGRFHGVCIALDLGIPVVGIPSNTWKIEAALASAGLQHRLVTDLDEVQRRLKTEGVEAFRYTPAELESIRAFRDHALGSARAMLRAICQRSPASLPSKPA
jgi:hypothetical protein